jgi:antitoxin component YwqK of YwqJK toxin-antitoxin module
MESKKYTKEQFKSIYSKQLLRDDVEYVIIENNVVKAYNDVFLGEFDIIQIEDKWVFKSYTINYYKNGQIECKYYYDNGKVHRVDKPAVIGYYENGQIEYEYWCVNNKYYRINKPSKIWYYKSGQIHVKEWIHNDEFYRENELPHAIEYYKSGQVREMVWFRDNCYYNYATIIKSEVYDYNPVVKTKR